MLVQGEGNAGHAGVQVVDHDRQASGSPSHAGDAGQDGRPGVPLELPPWAAHHAPPLPAGCCCLMHDTDDVRGSAMYTIKARKEPSGPAHATLDSSYSACACYECNTTSNGKHPNLAEKHSLAYLQAPNVYSLMSRCMCCCVHCFGNG